MAFIETAAFTPDGYHVFVHADNAVSLFGVDGSLEWSRKFEREVTSASAATDGVVTAVLTGGTSTDLTILDQNGEAVVQTQLLKHPEFAPPTSEEGYWDDVVVSRNGNLMMLKGGVPGQFRLRALDRFANRLWEVSLPSPLEGGSARLDVLSDGLLALGIQTPTAAEFHLIDGTGATKSTERVPGPIAEWRAAPDGTFITAVGGVHVTSLPVPVELSKPSSRSVNVAWRAKGHM
jgi:hypothetical protein